MASRAGCAIAVPNGAVEAARAAGPGNWGLAQLVHGLVWHGPCPPRVGLTWTFPAPPSTPLLPPLLTPSTPAPLYPPTPAPSYTPTRPAFHAPPHAPSHPVYTRPICTP
eukprot:scaffold12494_cov64-Isochrysis_galbana.AAC.1